jgi:transcription factor STE12
MYSQNAAMTAQKPETFMLSTEAQQALPHDAQVALNQVDNRECNMLTRFIALRLRH